MVHVYRTRICFDDIKKSEIIGERKMMIALTGGGTGGHLCIIRALLKAAKQRGEECIFIGSEHGKDKQYFAHEDDFVAKYFLNSRGVVGGGCPMKKIGRLSSILSQAFTARKLLSKHKVRAVFCVGGYSAAPASLAALMSFRPLFIHEQNATKGALNSLLKPFAKNFYSSFEEKLMPYPVEDIFYEKSRTRKELKTIIFLGGSAGASFINELAIKMAIILRQNDIKIIHQCGENEYDKCKAEYDKIGLEVDLFSFSTHMADKMSEADLAISRAGASTMFELCANALPAVFIPYPHAHKNHQFLNASFLKEKNLCEIFKQDSIIENDLFKFIFNMNLEEISSTLPKINAKGGAKALLDDALDALK